ncbi:DUF453 domain protein [Colletotrichum paranaense]|uniref:DUF453 domain protein n=2 Tax=Colletotrichum acutatum species complex TaxID=2707335 RepID=A0AAI9U4V8_9PEZI|nr:DUF453 domain protein [Colletotrichum paranaense]KAK1449556.1 DUF453 domain protein [Colletotrichum melonis]KAK1546669.1 DUF453 domain protein [Colletotrichum paranaense]
MFKSTDLPIDKSLWGSIFLGVIGSPDPYGRQLNGMGGGLSSLSKVCITGPPTHPEADVDYTFVSLGVKNTNVDYSSNCGNMSAAIGPYAVNSGLVPVESDGDKTVRIHNTNTGKIIHSTFPIVDGEAAANGSFSIDGVSGTAAKVKLDFVKPAGSRTGRLLPTGRKVDRFDNVRATCIDVGNPCVFVQAVELGVDGAITPLEIESHLDLLQKLDSIRRQAGVAMGLAQSIDEVPGSVPKIAFVSEPEQGSSSNVVARAISVGQPHKAIPVTVALALATAARMPETTVSECIRGQSDEIELSHASGTLKVNATFSESGEVLAGSVLRTARRLMEGTIFWK